MWHSLEEEESV